MPFKEVRQYSTPYLDYLHYANDLRGSLITSVAEMERAMDVFICKHFCSSLHKQQELMEVIIATKHLTFNAKADIAKHLLVKKEELTKTQSNKFYNTLLENIAAKRNIIAHNTLDTSNKAITNFQTDKDKTIYFIKYSNEKISFPFTKQDAINLGRTALAAKHVFDQINSPFRKSTRIGE